MTPSTATCDLRRGQPLGGVSIVTPAQGDRGYLVVDALVTTDYQSRDIAFVDRSVVVLALVADVGAIDVGGS